MRVREAKDFLVQQTAEQAALENVPLSGLEKRMMYFTKTGECPEDPIALNNAFETEYDTTTYEKKISLLMAQAYRRIKREDPEKLRLWNNAFRILSKGDHYLLLFWRQNKFRKSQMKQGCEPHCFSLGYNVAYCYDVTRVIKWLSKQARHGLAVSHDACGGSGAR
jgi:hypothetical protein